MSQSFIARNFLLGLMLTLLLAFVTAAPTFAESNQSGGQICAGNNLTLASGQSIDSLLAFGCNVTIEQGATVRGDLADFGGNVSIAGTVGGNIATFGGNISLAETAVISGNIASMGGNINQAPGAIVQGGINKNRFNLSPFTREFDFGFDLLGGIVAALAFAALGALVVIFAPNATRRVSDAAQARPLNTAGVGCLTLFLLPILCILLFITIIGIPVVLLLGFLSAVAWIFGSIGIGLVAGEKILQAFKARDVLPVVAVILGVVVLMIVEQVPVLGWLISFVVGLVGLGAVVMTRFGTRAYPTPPSMMMVPVAAAAGPSVPDTFMPSAASETKGVDVSPTENKSESLPTALDETASNTQP